MDWPVGSEGDERMYAAVEALLERKARSSQRYPVIICQFSRMAQNVHVGSDSRPGGCERDPS